MSKRGEGRRRARAARLATLAGVAPDPALPIAGAYEAIRAALARGQVVIVCGETGSGKSTQLPKLCLEAGRGLAGVIGMTQPRRIAARSIAARLRSELGCTGSTAVASKIRFADESDEGTLVKVMTDGVALEEIRGDRRLAAYDTLIIDEAHERSVEIDILLGYLKTLLPRRPELKLIVASATLDSARFAAYFDDAPVVSVSGRGYPVTTRYRSTGADGGELAERVAAAVEELLAEPEGDVLAFLPTERDIRDTARVLHRRGARAAVLPLFARLDNNAQSLVFEPGEQRRVVLATNVAETSLTVPRIRFVVDSGLARISRYSARTQLQRLPVEPISQAAAEQRRGRCGRLGPGICVRLYSEAEHERRPAQTEPEILRANLAAVILRLRSLGLAEPEHFPFLDPPPQRYVNDGYRLLGELGAIDADRRLTRTGRRLAALPLDPRLGRMLLAAEREGALEEVLVIVAALSGPDPRERPPDRQREADARHAAFADKRSDFLWYLNAWRRLEQAGGGSRALRRFCDKHMLAVQRVREWREVHRQLRELARARRWRWNERPASYARIHRALLAGLLGRIGRRGEDGAYRGARGLGFSLFPGSTLAGRQPQWVMVAEQTDTGRVYGRTAARIAPGWVRRVAGPLVSRRLEAAYWDRERGEVMAEETLSLYGLALGAARPVRVAGREPETARACFLDALAAGEVDTGARFAARNAASIARVAAWEVRMRRHDLLAGEEPRRAFYAERLPAGICGQADLERWIAEAPAAREQALSMAEADVLRDPGLRLDAESWPATIECGGACFELRYRFEPGHPEDGITLLAPLALLGQLHAERLDWLVPGLLAMKVEAVLRALPKRERRRLLPIADTVAAVVRSLAFAEGALWPRLAAALQAQAGLALAAERLQALALPPAARAHIAVLGEGGEVLARGDDPEALRARFGARADRDLARASDWPPAGRKVRHWDFGTLPAVITTRAAGRPVRAHPCLVREAREVRIALEADPARARASTAHALRLLVQRAMKPQFKRLRGMLAARPALELAWASLVPGREPAAELAEAVAGEAFPVAGEVRDAGAFEACCRAGEARMFAVAAERLAQLEAILLAAHAVKTRLAEGDLPAAAVEDMDTQLGGLVHGDFLLHMPAERVAELPRYLRAMQRRLDKLAHDPRRDERHLRTLAPLRDALLAADDWWCPAAAERRAFRWALEELRVSLFAQDLGVRERVSVERLQRMLAQAPQGERVA